MRDIEFPGVVQGAAQLRVEALIKAASYPTKILLSVSVLTRRRSLHCKRSWNTFPRVRSRGPSRALARLAERRIRPSANLRPARAVPERLAPAAATYFAGGAAFAGVSAAATFFFAFRARFRFHGVSSPDAVCAVGALCPRVFCLPAK